MALREAIASIQQQSRDSEFQLTDDDVTATLKVINLMRRRPELLNETNVVHLRDLMSGAVKGARRHARRQERKADVESINKAAINKAKKMKYLDTLPANVAAPLLLENVAAPEVSMSEEVSSSDEPGTTTMLNQSIHCYICKQSFRELHAFYGSLCPSCAAFNYAKRFQTSDLSGYVALVTGARVKIGYEIALKLLRAGCTVIATSRFPIDTVKRFAAQADFETFKDRLHVYGLDFRMLRAVEMFCEFLKYKYSHLDIIINNAALTIRRAPQYYEHLLEAESVPVAALPEALRAPLMQHVELDSQIARITGPQVFSQFAMIEQTATTSDMLVSSDSCRPSVSAALTQVALLPSDNSNAAASASSSAVFPTGFYDGDGQQVDLSGRNSWDLQMDEVSTVELLEVTNVNATAPFIINSKLKCMLVKSPHQNRFIVNVSAMEGKFNWDGKPTRHPHTNCAKAALNMQVRTCARNYAMQNIFMTAVDTGWVSDMFTTDSILRHAEETGLANRAPLDEIDGAARVLDPIFLAINEGVFFSGVFLKDYKPIDW